MTREVQEKLIRKKRHEIIDAYLTHDTFIRDILELELKLLEAKAESEDKE